MTTHEITWKLVPTETPPVWKSCPRCDGRRRFRCSDKFRVNGQGRRLDVWLIYKCEDCEQTWNATILSRVAPESIEPSLYQAFMDNEPAVAWRYAFQPEVMRRNQVDPELKVPFAVEGPAVELSQLEAGTLRISITYELLPEVRLETLLAQRLGVPRRILASLLNAGDLSIEPPGMARLSRRIRRPLVISVSVEKLRAALCASSGKTS